MADSWADKKITRRKALNTAGKAAIGIAAAAVVAGGGYLAYNALKPQPKTLTEVVWPDFGQSGSEEVFSPWEKQNDVTLDVELHTNGAAAVVAKIQSTFPSLYADIIMAYDPVFLQMSSQGWLQSLTSANIPNITQYPDSALVHDPTTNDVVGIGWDVVSSGWSYRYDLVPSDLDLTNYNNWLDPRLKGKIACSAMTGNDGSSVVLPALAFGGNENNVQPGFDFLVKLAKAGNLTQVYTADSDVSNAITSGEAWIVATSQAIVSEDVTAGVKEKLLFGGQVKTFAYREGWCILNPPKYPNPRLDLAYSALNYFYEAQNVSTFCGVEGVVPSNPNSAVPSTIPAGTYVPTNEYDQYTYIPNWTTVSADVDTWETYFEQNVLPVIQGSG